MLLLIRITVWWIEEFLSDTIYLRFGLPIADIVRFTNSLHLLTYRLVLRELYLPGGSNRQFIRQHISAEYRVIDTAVAGSHTTLAECSSVWIRRKMSIDSGRWSDVAVGCSTAEQEWGSASCVRCNLYYRYSNKLVVLSII